MTVSEQAGTHLHDAKLVEEMCAAHTVLNVFPVPSPAGGAMHPGAVLVLAQDLLRGLVELHTLGITMADLKPDNVLLDEGGTPLLCDFGISCAITTHTTCHANTSIKGTFNYMCVGMAGWELLMTRLMANGSTGYAYLPGYIALHAGRWSSGRAAA